MFDPYSIRHPRNLRGFIYFEKILKLAIYPVDWPGWLLIRLMGKSTPRTSPEDKSNSRTREDVHDSKVFRPNHISQRSTILYRITNRVRLVYRFENTQNTHLASCLLLH